MKSHIDWSCSQRLNFILIEAAHNFRWILLTVTHSLQVSLSTISFHRFFSIVNIPQNGGVFGIPINIHFQELFVGVFNKMWGNPLCFQQLHGLQGLHYSIPRDYPRLQATWQQSGTSNNIIQWKPLSFDNKIYIPFQFFLWESQNHRRPTREFVNLFFRET